MDLCSSSVPREDRSEGRLPALLSLVSGLVPENPVVLEAGSHNGSDTCMLSAAWPGGRIYAVEPTPQSYEALVARNLPNVSPRQLAFSSEDGAADFYVEQFGDGGASSLLEPEEWFFRGHVKQQEIIRVTTRTLDAWCKDEGLDRIDFMWLDLEGMELPVLRHGQEILNTAQAIFTEVNFVKARKGYTMYPDLHRFMARQGLHEVWRESQGGVPWGRWTGNVLYARQAPATSAFRTGREILLPDSIRRLRRRVLRSTHVVKLGLASPPPVLYLAPVRETSRSGDRRWALASTTTAAR